MGVPAFSTSIKQCWGIHPHHSQPEKFIGEYSRPLKEFTGKSVNVPITFAYQTSQNIYRDVYASYSFPRMELCPGATMVDSCG